MANRFIPLLRSRGAGILGYRLVNGRLVYFPAAVRRNLEEIESAKKKLEEEEAEKKTTD